MKLKDVKTDSIWAVRQGKKGSVTSTVSDAPKPIKKLTPKEMQSSVRKPKIDFYRKARTPGLGN